MNKLTNVLLACILLAVAANLGLTLKASRRPVVFSEPLTATSDARAFDPEIRAMEKRLAETHAQTEAMREGFKERWGHYPDEPATK